MSVDVENEEDLKNRGLYKYERLLVLTFLFHGKECSIQDPELLIVCDPRHCV